MNNPYQTPLANIETNVADENNSGGGKGTIPPPGIAGWSWGAFFWNWIWALGNKTWIGLFAIIPYVGFIVSIYLGIKGRELAWQNKRWDSIEHFNEVQRKWTFWSLVFVGIAMLGIVAAIVIPFFAGRSAG